MASDLYEKHRDRAADRQSDLAREGRDIGEIPRCVNPQRRAKCEGNLRKQLETYHNPSFPLKWSDKHLEFIGDVERTVLEWLQKASALPRGTGKTTILERSVLWGILHRHHLFAMLLGATDPKGVEMLDSVKTEIMTNDLLLEDFPELVYPLRCLEWIANRARGQHCGGEPTYVAWGKRTLVFPTIDDKSGPIIRVGGLLGAVRGAKATLPDGTVIRPSVVLIDDPQTRRSAKSAIQSEERAQIVSGDVMGMAGPGKPIAALLACTVIEKQDMADKVLNRELHPEWRGQRSKLLESFPERMDLWETYREIYVDELRADGDGRNALKFYRQNRKDMDRGAKVSWKDRFNRESEISAVQNAMNLWYRDQESFFSEYQNDPLDLAAGDEGEILTSDEIARRTNHLTRNSVPADAAVITAFVDVHDSLLYFVVVAWAEDFTGWVIDYGTWPEQQASYFTLRSAKATIQRKWPKLSNEARLRKALDALLTGEDALLMRREWKREGDGAVMQIELAGCDAQYKGEDVIYPAILASPFRPRLLPSHGKGVTARQKPFSEYQRKAGEKRGLHWFIPRKSGRKSLRHLVSNVNFWKSHVHARLATDPAERGSLTLWKAQPKQHAMLADHLTAEKRFAEEAHGRKADEWKNPDKADNHLFDGVVGCAIAASIKGCELRVTPRSTPDGSEKPKPRPRVARALNF